MCTPTKDTVIGKFERVGNSDILQIVNADSSIVSRILFNGAIVGPGHQTARVSTTINPGFTVVDLLWPQPFVDDTYVVLFPNPPFAPGGAAPIPPPNTKTDAFTTSLNPAWTAQFGTFDISSAELEIATIDSGNSRASMGYTDSGWSTNQFSQLQITATTSGAGGLGPALYVQDASFYGFYIDTSVAYLFKQVGLVTTVLNSAPATLSLNDVLRLEIAGQTLTAKQNGTVILTAFEAVPLTFGAPGVNGFQTSTLRANNWQGGNLQIPVVIVPVALGPWTYISTGLGVQFTLQNLNLTPLEVQIDAVGQVFV